jgi:processive 1,2-diacylglycerol beta-glucosyltransferase
MAIEKALKIISPQTEILSINAFNYTNPITEKIINKIYMGVIQKAPQVWDYLYDNPAILKKIKKIKETVNKFNAPKFKGLFDKFQPDVVACTQAFPCGMVADFKKNYGSKLKLIAVLTDYVPHSYWIYDAVDYYIAPSEEVKIRLVKKGVAPEKIKSLGIPFDSKFNQNIKRNEISEKLKLNSNLPTVLIMGGGHGLGPMKIIIKSLERVKIELQEIIITGANKKLYNSLKEKVKKYKKKILVFGYADNINELMGISDIIITKPGGITTAEALTKRLPMIIVDPIPGQEANNARYLTEKGAAIQIDAPGEVYLTIEDLLKDSVKLMRMREAAERISKPNSSLDIAKLILSI